MSLVTISAKGADQPLAQDESAQVLDNGSCLKGPIDRVISSHTPPRLSQQENEVAGAVQNMIEVWIDNHGDDSSMK